MAGGGKAMTAEDPAQSGNPRGGIKGLISRSGANWGPVPADPTAVAEARGDTMPARWAVDSWKYDAATM